MSKEEIENMENRIIEAAKKVFIRKGYESAKMGDIAMEAGISRTSLHYYFRNKETLFTGILAGLMNKFLPDLESILAQEGTLLDKLPAIIHAYNTILRQNEHLPLFFLNELQRDPDHLYKAILQDPARPAAILNFRRIIIENMEKGYIRKIPLIELMTTFIGLMVFPVLVKKPFSDAILNGDEKIYEEFLKNREVLILQIMQNLLTP